MSIHGVIDRIRRGKATALRFIDFIWTFVLYADEQAFESLDVVCDDEKSHIYFRRGWLVPLVTRGWVPTGKMSLRANAESLETTLATVRRHSDDSQIEIDIRDSQTRFRIGTTLAQESGLDLDSFVEFVKARTQPARLLQRRAGVNLRMRAAWEKPAASGICFVPSLNVSHTTPVIGS